MGMRYFYEFTGRILINAENQDQAENMVTDIDLNDYIVDEDIYEIDENYIPCDLKKRKDKLGTTYHPMDDPEEYENFRRQVRKYGKIFREFLNGKIDRDEMLKQMDQADGKEIDDDDLVYSIDMVDLVSKVGKRSKLIPVD